MRGFILSRSTTITESRTGAVRREVQLSELGTFTQPGFKGIAKGSVSKGRGVVGFTPVQGGAITFGYPESIGAPPFSGQIMPGWLAVTDSSAEDGEFLTLRPPGSVVSMEIGEAIGYPGEGLEMNLPTGGTTPTFELGALMLDNLGRVIPRQTAGNGTVRGIPVIQMEYPRDAIPGSFIKVMFIAGTINNIAGYTWGGG